MRDALIKGGLASPFRWSPAFVVYTVATAADVASARTLFQLSYDHVRGVGDAALLARIASLPHDAL